jgi:hypothetical protein
MISAENGTKIVSQGPQRVCENHNETAGPSAPLRSGRDDKERVTVP